MRPRNPGGEHISSHVSVSWRWAFTAASLVRIFPFERRRPHGANTLQRVQRRSVRACRRAANEAWSERGFLRVLAASHQGRDVGADCRPEQKKTSRMSESEIAAGRCILPPPPLNREDRSLLN